MQDLTEQLRAKAKELLADGTVGVVIGYGPTGDDGDMTAVFARQPDPAGRPARLASQADGAATGLALLAFLGAGYDHYDDKYQAAVQRGLEFLLASQQQDGGLYLPRDRQPGSVTMLYGHGIASMP